MSDNEDDTATLQQVSDAEEQSKPSKPKRKRTKKTNGIGPAILDAWGIRAGTARSGAAALYARPEGASLAEVKAVVGSVQYNVLTDLKAKGYKVTTTGERGKQRYYLTK